MVGMYNPILDTIESLPYLMDDGRLPVVQSVNRSDRRVPGSFVQQHYSARAPAL